jgi:hypothetical protein
VVFAAFSADVDPGTGNARETLFAVNGDGSGLRKLLGPTFTYLLANAISGDGSTVAYVTGDFATGRQEAGVIGFDGSGQRALIDSEAIYNRWLPGLGRNLPSNERIQLNADGSRLLLGSSGVLFDTRGGGRLALSLDIPPPSGQSPLATDGLYRATMDAAVTRVVYLFQPVGVPRQLARLDLNPADLRGAPVITEPSVAPDFVLTEGRSTATISARVTPIEPAPWVGSRILRDGLPDDEGFGRIGLADDGATAGDPTARDGVYTNNAVATTCCAQPGPRTVRIQAELVLADGLQHASAVDITPFAVVTDPSQAIPATLTPPTLAPPIEETATAATSTPPPPPPPTGVPGPNAPAPPAPAAGVTPSPPMPPADPAQATIAAQATLIADLQGQGTTPTVPAAPGAPGAASETAVTGGAP